MKNVILFSMICFTVFGCKTQQQNTITGKTAAKTAPKPFVTALPHVVIYKTTKDYNCNVPVMLSKDKTQIDSYPHPTDLFFNGNFALPSQLHNGYLLDNRGIGENVAFLKFTYEEYSKLAKVPTLEELQKSIIDKDPLIELWDCGIGTNSKEMETQLNEWIDNNMLSEKCRQIK